MIPAVVAMAKGLSIWSEPMVAPVPLIVRSTAVGVEVAAEATPLPLVVLYKT